MQPIRIGICGFGTVGGGTFNVLQRNSNEIARRTGCPIVIEQIARAVETVTTANHLIT